VFELLDALQGASPEGSRVASDVCLAGSLYLRNPTIECRDEFQQFPHSAASCHRHRFGLCRSATVRVTFHISPHFVHRQYVSASGVFSFVTIAADRHLGQASGAW